MIRHEQQEKQTALDQTKARLAQTVEAVDRLLILGARPREAAEQWRQAVAVDPQYVEPYSVLAWLLATCPAPEVQNPADAVELATKATALAPKDGFNWAALGVAQYRVGNIPGALAALRKSIEFRKSGSALFFLAMAHWKADDKQQARARSTRPCSGWTSIDRTTRNSAASVPKPRSY